MLHQAAMTGRMLLPAAALSVSGKVICWPGSSAHWTSTTLDLWRSGASHEGPPPAPVTAPVEAAKPRGAVGLDTALDFGA